MLQNENTEAMNSESIIVYIPENQCVYIQGEPSNIKIYFHLHKLHIHQI